MTEAHQRLLDLLKGWSMYTAQYRGVAADPETQWRYAKEAATAKDIYAAAALAEDMANEEIGVFLLRHVLKAVIHGPK